MKNEILAKLFSSRWNYYFSKSDDYLISLYYNKGGFTGLYDFIVSEKEIMSRGKKSVFSSYYSSDLIETLEKAKKDFGDDDFREYIFKSNRVSFNKNNFEKLEEYGLLQYYYDFSGSFRGNIECYHEIGNYAIIETFSEKDGKRFYNKAEFTTCFETLEQAILWKMYNGKYFDTLLTLLDSISSDDVA
jgi:hypothetical protein